MIRFVPRGFPQDIPSDAEWLLRCLVLYGANTISVDVDGPKVNAIRFTFPGGREHTVDYSGRPAPPCMIVGRGRA